MYVGSTHGMVFPSPLIVVMDERGYLKIVGRIKDIIIRGGENISPREVEEFLYTHPAIQVCVSSSFPKLYNGVTDLIWRVGLPCVRSTQPA